MTAKMDMSRWEFLQCCVAGFGCLAANPIGADETQQRVESDDNQSRWEEREPATLDLREFILWIREVYGPSVRILPLERKYMSAPGMKENALYGVADMACILYTIDDLDDSDAERWQWARAFAEFQESTTGWFREHPPQSLSREHNTAFVLGAMQLLSLRPEIPVILEEQYENISEFLRNLHWRYGMYQDSHRGAGIGSIRVLVPSLHDSSWFLRYFAECDRLFDPNNGMMGQAKPKRGDIDQIGGTFHYAFLYEYFNRRMPYPEARVNAILGLQRPDGYWDPDNRLWMTLDAIYLMTRTVRYHTHRINDVKASVKRALAALQRDVYSQEGRRKVFDADSGVHSLTAAISVVAEAQHFLGAGTVRTDWPLKLVLDRRPFI